MGTEFGDIAFIRPWDNKTNAGDLTIKTLDQHNKQIIVLYNDKNVIEGKLFNRILKSVEVKKARLNGWEKLFNRFHTNTLVSPNFYEIALDVTNYFLSFNVDSQLIWPPWQTFTTVNLRKNELLDYIRKIFSKKFQNCPKHDSPWIIYGIQGVDVSYVSWSHMIFSIFYSTRLLD